MKDNIKTISVSDKCTIGMSCGVCGAFVPVYSPHITFILCEDCIKAIKWAKENMKNDRLERNA
jgi:hypothetical protein